MNEKALKTIDTWVFKVSVGYNPIFTRTKTKTTDVDRRQGCGTADTFANNRLHL